MPEIVNVHDCKYHAPPTMPAPVRVTIDIGDKPFKDDHLSVLLAEAVENPAAFPRTR